MLADAIADATFVREQEAALIVAACVGATPAGRRLNARRIAYTRDLDFIFTVRC
jgi:hypothetical protein